MLDFDALFRGNFEKKRRGNFPKEEYQKNKL